MGKKILTYNNEVLSGKGVKMVKIESNLLNFPGFYNTLLEYDIDRYCLKEEFKEHNIDYTVYMSKNLDIYDYVDITPYEKDVIFEYIHVSLHALKDHVSSIEFVELCKPKFYNYENDTVIVSYYLSPDNVNNIKKYLYKNFNEFEEFLKVKHTSCSGYVSFVSNNPQTWIDEFLTDNRLIGEILGFIYNNEYQSPIEQNTNICPTLYINYDKIQQDMR